MANLLTRIKNTIMADLNEAVDKKERKNPIAMLNQYLRECEGETEKTRRLLERQCQLKEQFTREYRQALNMAEKRGHQAEIAQKAGETELYMFAAQEQQHFAERAERLKEALVNAAKQQNELEQKYEVMKHKLKDMQIRRMELMGRENVTRAHQQMDKVIDNDDFSNQSYSYFNEIEAYLDRVEQQVNHSYYHSTIDNRIAVIEKAMKSNETHSNS
ncbi:PspA/IM30 family protein [Bacillus sp. B15-48]|uniref:PspA/IM30 family protein n=1 Tax=Bacillus sp. B15-48 TaxID=1548601 RepID=UPI001940175F|nr:PspA/IM30 family protein [Bacillus sp. B15-48]MBM4764456.1 PspA/IM30 family protein [Bacillus sp. B15-48]